VNNLKSGVKPEAARAALTNLGLRPDARAEQLSVAHFAALFRALHER